MGLLAAGCRPAQTPPPQIASVTAATVEAMHGTGAPTVRYFGTVRPHRQVDLAFRVSGYVRALLSVRDATGETRPVQAGDRVSAGAVLARVGSADYQAQSNAAGAAANTARAQAAQALAKLAQARAAHRQSAEGVDEARAALLAVQSQRAQAASGVGQAQAGVSDAEAGVTLAQSNWETTDDLYRSGSATRPQEDAAKAALASAAAKLAAARQAQRTAQGRVAEASGQIAVCRARIRQAQSGADAGEAAISEAGAAVRAAQAQVAQADAVLAAQRVPVAETVLRAPLTGVVLARRVEIGSLVAPGAPAFVLADLARLNIVFGLPEGAASDMRVGRHVGVTVGSDPLQTGTVTEIAPTADEKTRLFDVQVSVPNAGGTAKIGTTATLDVAEAGQQDASLVAPISALTQSPNQPSAASVMLITQDGGHLTVRRRDVELGATFGDKIVVRGLSRGARIVADAPGLLSDGEPVVIATPEAGGS